MAEVQQLRVQQTVDAMVKSVERETIRKMQGLVFRRSANCCEDNQASMQPGHQCLERCHAPLAQAQALGTSELERFQYRLARHLPSPVSLFKTINMKAGWAAVAHAFNSSTQEAEPGRSL
uniref:Protein FAM136A n=1 Tax=Peromyscus maniculatus bairdii TaxID=230844 RepID=A0A8C8TP42_PERMB